MITARLRHHGAVRRLLSVLPTYRGRLLLFALLLGYLSLCLGTFPKVYIDEPWESIPAFQLWTQGTLNDPVLAGRDYNAVHLVAPRLLQAVILAPLYGIFGTRLLTGRLASLLFAAGTLAVFFRLLMVNGTRQRYAWLGVGLLGTDNLFYVFARLIRPEIMMTFLGVAASHFLLRGLAERRLTLMLLAGSLAGLGGWCHPNFALIIVSLLLLLCWEYGPRMWRTPGFLTFSGGVFLGLLPYLVYLVYQDGGDGFSHVWAQIHDRVPRGDSRYWRRILATEAERYRQYLFYPYRTFVVLVQGVFLVLSLRLRGRLARLSRIVIATHVALFPFLVLSRSARYLLPVIPFLIALIVQTVQELSGAPRKSSSSSNPGPAWHRLARGCALALLLYQFAGNPVMIAARRVTGYEQVLVALRRYIPPGSRVWGSMMFWFGFTDCRYRTQYTFGADLYDFRPQYVITGDDVIWKKKRYFRLERYKHWDKLIASIDEYIAPRGKLIAVLPDRGYGTLRVWKVDESAPGGNLVRMLPLAPVEGTRPTPGKRPPRDSATQVRLRHHDMSYGRPIR